MRTPLVLLAFTLPICACGGSQLPNSTPPNSSRQVTPASISAKDLYIGENFYGFYSGRDVLILQNGTFKTIGSISVGVSGPVGSWVDSHGLYVANHYVYDLRDYGDVIEYASPKSSGFGYSAQMLIPQAVTTDSSGNVYESDAGGWVNEYAQKKNKVIATCALPYSGTPVGVAVDGAGDVFVAYIAYTSGVGYIQEFTDFPTCFGSSLGVKLKLRSNGGGMALDRYGNIIICESYNKTVDIIKPPYNSVSAHLGSGYTYPTDVTINRANNRVWFVDLGTNVVYELYYPSGKVVAKLSGGSSDTFLTAVDGSNYTP